MKLGLYAIMDTKAGAFNNPMPLLSRGAAIRSFADAVNTSGNDFNKHPEDYVLFYIGDYDQVSGKLFPADAPQSVIGAWELFEKAVA